MIMYECNTAYKVTHVCIISRVDHRFLYFDYLACQFLQVRHFRVRRFRSAIFFGYKYAIFVNRSTSKFIIVKHCI